MSDTKAPTATRHILVTAGEGQTGRLLIELLLTDDEYASKYEKISALVFSEEAKDKLAEFPTVEVHVHDPKHPKQAEKLMASIDTCMLIPPSRKDKLDITRALLQAAQKTKNVVNLVLLSSVGCDYADPDKQPRLREFIDIEALALAPKSDPSTGDTAHSPVIIRAGFYAENLLLYTHSAQSQGKLPLPVDKDHKFAPVALGDVVAIAAEILTSEGPEGIAEHLRGQLIVATGPRLVAGPDMAQAASQALGSKLEFESITEDHARTILAGAEIDDAEREYLLEYYSLVREGKTAYVADTAFQLMFGHRGQEPPDFFTVYSASFKPKRRRLSKAGGPQKSPRRKAAAIQEDEDMAEESGTRNGRKRKASVA